MTIFLWFLSFFFIVVIEQGWFGKAIPDMLRRKYKVGDTVNQTNYLSSNGLVIYRFRDDKHKYLLLLDNGRCIEWQNSFRLSRL